MNGAAVAAQTDVNAVETRMVAAGLERRFSGAVVWYGTRTRRWWAVLRHRGRRGELIEAANPVELAEAITRTCRRATINGVPR